MTLRILRTTAFLLFWTVLAGVLMTLVGGTLGATVPVLGYAGGLVVVSMGRVVGSRVTR